MDNTNNSLNYDYTSTSWKHAVEKLKELRGDRNIEIYSIQEITEDSFRKGESNDICTFFPDCDGVRDPDYITVIKMETVLSYALNNISAEDVENSEYSIHPHQCFALDTKDTHPGLRKLHEKYKKYRII